MLAGINAHRPGLPLTGGEIFEEAMTIAQARVPDARLVKLDGRTLPFTDGEFDTAGVFDVLEHVDDDIGLMKELRRVLGPGGTLFVTVPQHPWLWSTSDSYAHHRRRYRRREMEAKLRTAGFEIRRTTSFVSVLLPVMALGRLIRRKPRADWHPIDDLRPSPVVNGAFERLLQGERGAIRAGVNFPAGGSLLVVAVAA